MNQDNENVIDISIVIVSWNVVTLLCNCLSSISRNLVDHFYEVIVVDNASTDETVATIRDRYPWVRLVANSENYGFAKANNQGFKLARGKYIFILNPDTVIDKDTIPRLERLLEDCPNIGMVGPRVVFPDGTIQKSCARLLPNLFSTVFIDNLRFYKLPVIGKWLTKKLSTPYSYLTCQSVEAISGASMLVRKNVLDEIGGFGEEYIHSGEDLDLCFHIRSIGWSIYYVSNAIVVHFAGQSSLQAPIRTVVNQYLSQQEYFNRCFGKHYGWIYRMLVQFFDIPIIFIGGIINLLLFREGFIKFTDRIQIIKGIYYWRKIK